MTNSSHIQPRNLIIDDQREIRDAVDMDAKVVAGRFDLTVLDVMMRSEDGYGGEIKLSNIAKGRLQVDVVIPASAKAGTVLRVK